MTKTVTSWIAAAALSLVLSAGAFAQTPPGGLGFDGGSAATPDNDSRKTNNVSAQNDKRERRQNIITARKAKSVAIRHVAGQDTRGVEAYVELVDPSTYRVRVVKDGRITDVFIDARTGRVKT